MQNFIQPGDVVTLTAPYQRNGGQGALVGSLFGVATSTVANGAQGEFLTEGVVDLDKTSAQAWTVGALIYWDDVNKVCTNIASTNKLIGVALAAAANPSPTGRVRLNAAFTS